MYSTCLTCHARLGSNEEVGTFPVGERLAFDARRGRLWVICTACGRWNLSPLEERWEAIEECERLFRHTRLRVSTENVSLARRPSGLELVRIGPAPRPEVAEWRYGGRLLRLQIRASRTRTPIATRATRVLGQALSLAMGAVSVRHRGTDALAWLRIRHWRDRIVDAVPVREGERAVIRYRHLADAQLIRPDRMEPWRLVIHHEHGPIELSSEVALRSAGKLLAALNGSRATPQQVLTAVSKLEDAGNADSYFARVAALALRTSWGRVPDADRHAPIFRDGISETERLALYLTNRSFWARGSIGSDPEFTLLRLPLEERLALEMAVTEDTERDALEGEMVQLEAAWREAEEIAAIADGLFDERSATGPLHSLGLAWRRAPLPTRG